MARDPGWPRLDYSQPLRVLSIPVPESLMDITSKMEHADAMQELARLNPRAFVKMLFANHEEEEVQPTTAEQEIRAAAPPNPNADKQGKTAEDELDQLAYLFGCLDRYEDTPSRHMKLAGYSSRVQNQYLRGRRDRDGIGGD